MKNTGKDMELKIDVENRRVLVNGVEWKSMVELKEEIKKRVDSGDFNVVNLTVALKKLESIIEDYQEVTVKIHKDTLEDYQKSSKKIGISVETLLRNAIETYSPNAEEIKKERTKQDIIKNKEQKPPIKEPLKKQAYEEPKHHGLTKIQCKNCGHMITISTSKRPIIIRCSKCGTKNKIE